MSQHPRRLKALFAYPSSPTALGQCITAALPSINASDALLVEAWAQVDNWGLPLIEPILTRIIEYDILIADITRLNFNVTFEVGFAIGARKRVLLVVNKSQKTDEALFKEVGIYDTLGYKTYENTEELTTLFATKIDPTPIYFPNLRDTNAPIYLLEKPARTDDVGRVASRIKKSRLRYRSFTPSEEARLPVSLAIEHVAKSVSVIVPLCTMTERDSDQHNIRAAFLAGLATGMERHVLVLRSGEEPAPLDVRDLVTRYNKLADIDEFVNELVFKTYDYLNNRPVDRQEDDNILSTLSVGDPLAENEFATLGNYYVRTDEFNRSRRGEVNLVVGRKGMGKTALWAQLRDDIRRNTSNIVADLKPEGYQLLKLKEEVLSFLSEGAKNHLVVAFWEYLLYMELALKLLEKDADRHLRDRTLYDKYLRLEGFFRFDPAFVGEGDFSERLKSLAERLIDRYKATYGNAADLRLSTEQITELMYSTHLRDLRSAVTDYLQEKDEVWILFDNLDKGWASHGLAREDVFLLRCLLDASRKIRNDVRRAIPQFYVIVFIRNDIYQMLMDETPDFGKESRASLDWSDDEHLKTVLARRLRFSRIDGSGSLDQIFQQICVPYYSGQKTLDLFVQMSLMRPRNLLKLFAYCRGAAVNRGKTIIGDDEIKKGIAAYSDDILIDFSNEIRDLQPEAENILYKFIGEKAEYKPTEIVRIISSQVPQKLANQVLDCMLYYGIFGIAERGGFPIYIFNVGYDLKKMRALASKTTASRYYLNPALHPALGIRW